MVKQMNVFHVNNLIRIVIFVQEKQQYVYNVKEIMDYHLVNVLHVHQILLFTIINVLNVIKSFHIVHCVHTMKKLIEYNVINVINHLESQMTKHNVNHVKRTNISIPTQEYVNKINSIVLNR